MAELANTNLDTARLTEPERKLLAALTQKKGPAGWYGGLVLAGFICFTVVCLCVSKEGCPNGRVLYMSGIKAAGFVALSLWTRKSWSAVAAGLLLGWHLWFVACMYRYSSLVLNLCYVWFGLLMLVGVYECWMRAKLTKKARRPGGEPEKTPVLETTCTETGE